MKTLLIIIGLIFFGLIIWFLIHISNRSAKDWFLSENQYDLAERIIELIKQKKDEL